MNKYNTSDTLMSVSLYELSCFRFPRNNVENNLNNFPGKNECAWNK